MILSPIGLCPSRAAPARRHADDAVGRGPTAGARRLSLGRLVRAVPRLGKLTVADDALGSSRRRADVSSTMSARRSNSADAVARWCDGKIPDCLPIMAGWNYVVRLYRPRRKYSTENGHSPRRDPHRECGSLAIRDALPRRERAHQVSASVRYLAPALARCSVRFLRAFPQPRFFPALLSSCCSFNK